MATVTVGGREYETIYKGTDGSYYIPDSRFSGQFIPFSPGSASKRTINSGGLNILALPSPDRVTQPMSYREEVMAGVNTNLDRTAGFYGIKPESSSVTSPQRSRSTIDYTKYPNESIAQYNARIAAARAGTQASATNIITDNVTGNRYTMGPNGSYIPYLDKPQAPSNASAINTGFGQTNFPSLSPSSGNITSASAGTAGMSTLLEQLMKQSEEYQSRADQLAAQNDKNAKSFLSDLFNSDSQAQIREDAYRDIGILPREYFADQRARIAEIEALTREYNAVKAARDQQIAATNDKLGSMNFINNQIAQIERNAAPRLNEISANVNAKAATLQALQGNFAEARSFVDQAVNDAVADKKFQFDVFEAMYQVNRDQIERLDSRYKDSFNAALQIAQQQYEDARDDKKLLGELMISNPQAGISIGDSLDEAYRKIGINPMSPERRLLEAQIANTLDNAEGGGSDDDSGTAYISIMQEAINNGASPAEAARAAARVSEEDGIPVSQATLNSWVQQAQSLTPVGSGSTQVPRIDSRSTLSYLPSATRETIGSFFSNLFGG